jgi:hypothetical protein
MAALASTLERTDEAIRNDVLFELKYDPKMSSSSDVAVAVKEGVVTLSGYVSSYWEGCGGEGRQASLWREGCGQRYPSQGFHHAH